MSTLKDKIQANFSTKDIKWLVAEVIFVIVAILVIRNLTKIDVVVPTIKMQNSSVLNDKISSQDIELLERKIYKQVKTDVANYETATGEAIIREDTISNVYLAATDMTITRFIIDYEALKSSYQVSLISSKDANNSTIKTYQSELESVYCAAEDDQKYADHACDNSYVQIIEANAINVFAIDATFETIANVVLDNNNQLVATPRDDYTEEDANAELVKFASSLGFKLIR